MNWRITNRQAKRHGGRCWLSAWLCCCCCWVALSSYAQKQAAYAAGNGNPLLPGYFADPTVRKFGNTFYIYSTTDGNGGGHGPSQVWTSTDFVNWTMHDMNWPNTNYYWAPDVVEGNDGHYYMYYCQPVDIYGASSKTPTGPWKPQLPGGKPMITNYFVPGVITLDGQTFKDDDGKVYMFWGTWGIYPDHGCGVGLLNADMHSFAKTAKIPNTDAKGFFEAPFMFKRKGIYYLTYSSGFCEDSTYRVQYAMSKTGPMGPFMFGKNNPILSTNSDGSIHGPGHESVMQLGNDFYMVYHRHNNPHSNGGYHRQVCADKMMFDAEGNIEKLIPTHTGVGALGEPSVTVPNEAYGKKISASSFYNNYSRPSFANDDNNGTLWKPADNGRGAAWINIDLGVIKPVKQILTQFEYPTWYYQYFIEASVDGLKWDRFADRRNNHQHGSPMVDNGNTRARYIRLTITGTAYPGLYKAIWNIKVYGKRVVDKAPETVRATRPFKCYYTEQKEGLLIALNADELEPGSPVLDWHNNGKLGGKFTAKGTLPIVDVVAGKKAIVFNGSQALYSSVQVPSSLAGNNSYTVAYTVYTDKLKNENPVLSWTHSETEHRSATFGYGSNAVYGAAQHFGVSDQAFKPLPTANQWHQVVITFDGSFEKIYVDGKLNSVKNKMLFLQPADRFVVGARTNQAAYFTGAVSNIRIYNQALPAGVISKWAGHTKPSEMAIYLDAGKLKYGRLQFWKNNGDAGGGLAASCSPGTTVTDIAGKIAVCFNGECTLLPAHDLHIAPVKNYTLAAGIYRYRYPVQPHAYRHRLTQTFDSYGKYLSPGKWHYFIKVVHGSRCKIYIDGLPVSSSSNKGQVLDDLVLGNTFKGAINKLMLVTKLLSSAAVKELNYAWINSLHSPAKKAPAFEMAPKAITPNIVEMKAANYSSRVGLQYDFINEDDSSKCSGWQDAPYYLSYGLAANKKYHYALKIKDSYGNVSAETPPVAVTTSSSLFKIVEDRFLTDNDFVQNGITGTVWNGLIGAQQQQLFRVSSGGGALLLESKGSNWDGNPPYGPFLYRSLSGNFVAEVEVTEVSGLREHQVAGNSDMGLMVRIPKQPGAPGAENLIQNSIFPAWNCGNMLTNLVAGNRLQNNTQTGWQYNRFLQIQKAGDIFYMRTSNDGIHWVDLPGSPLKRPDMAAANLQIGLYHSTYGPNASYVKFSNFKLITPAGRSY